MRYADIKYPDVANGTGIRVSLFLQGCSRQCDGCFNPETWDHKGGSKFTGEERQKIYEYLSYSWVTGLSILGGEPLEQVSELTAFLKTVKRKFPTKDIWLWTGYTFEKVCEREIFKYVDYVVDGEFIESKKDLSLVFRGSSNQRILHLEGGKLIDEQTTSV